LLPLSCSITMRSLFLVTSLVQASGDKMSAWKKTGLIGFGCESPDWTCIAEKVRISHHLAVDRL